MASVPPPSLRRLGDALTAAMQRLDGCPECVHNTELPDAAMPLGNGWRCHYRCSDCGHTWTACWTEV